MFLIPVARAIAPVWEVTRTASGKIANLAKKKAFVNHYSFHIMDPERRRWRSTESAFPAFVPRDSTTAGVPPLSGA